MSALTQAVDRFHDHLDVCAQCREHPFGLCREGYLLLRAAAGRLAPSSPAQDPHTKEPTR